MDRRRVVPIGSHLPLLIDSSMVTFETREADWLSFDEAVERMMAIGEPRPADLRPPENTLGLALGEAVTARVTLPPGPTSHMDGYAVRFESLLPSENRDRSRPLAVLGASRPGAPWTGTLGTDAIRIMTGALLPEGADTVIPVEETDREEASPGTVRVSLSPGLVRGQHVRPTGEEMMEGDRLAEAGETVTPGLLALLCATGESELRVHPAPAVALLVTGDELVAAGDPEALSGGIFRADILSPSIPPLIQRAGGRPLAPRRVGDDPQALRGAIREASAEADLIVTTGGASMGEADLVKRVLEDLGLRLDFWRIRMRPGSPVSLGRIPRVGGAGEVPVLGLPGNPVSSFVTFLVLGFPAVRTLGGHTSRRLPRTLATAAERLSGPPGLARFFRVRFEWDRHPRLLARLCGSQGSGAIRSMARAEGLAMVPPGIEAIEEGEPVEVMLIPGTA